MPQKANIAVRLYNGGTRLAVMVSRCGWDHVFSLSVEKPLPPQFIADSLIAGAYKQGQDLTLSRNRKFLNRGSDGIAQGQVGSAEVSVAPPPIQMNDETST